ncbi:MAG: fibronectin type III domain-containing protein [Alkalispirochaeta sp.]
MGIRVIVIRQIAFGVLLVTAALFPAFAQIPERNDPELSTVSLGGIAGWGPMEEMKDTIFRPGWRGGEEIVLSDRGAPDVEDQGPRRNDLVAPFDHSIGDYDGRYTLASTAGVRHLSHVTRYGTGAVAFDGSGALEFRPESGSLFTPYAQGRSFVIDLWAFPTGTTDGVDLLRWSGAFLTADTPVLQELRFHVTNGRFRWELRNLVARIGETETLTMETAVLSGRRSPIPERWTHHRLRYDAEVGQLSYIVDGVPEAIEYLNPPGRSGATGGAAIIFGDDTGEGLVLGRRFRGVIDEFAITLDEDAPLRTARYDHLKGEVVTAPVALGEDGGVVEEIRYRAETPGNTEVRLSFRSGDRYGYSPWRELPGPDASVTATPGRFVQFRAELLPDASGDRTPRLQEITLAYRPFDPPAIPKGVRGTSIPGGVRLTWDEVRSDDVTEYRVLFGERPGRYTGAQGVQSPVIVTGERAVEIEGLEDDRSYVFAVESVDRHGRQSALSREIEVRAGRR